MGSIRRRGQHWYVRYMDHRGVQIEESSKSHRKSDAIRLLQLREGKKAEGGPVLPAMGKITFDEAAADLVADYTIMGKKSLPQARRRIRLHLRTFFGGRTRIAAITAARVIEYSVGIYRAPTKTSRQLLAFSSETRQRKRQPPRLMQPRDVHDHRR